MRPGPAIPPSLVAAILPLALGGGPTGASAQAVPVADGGPESPVEGVAVEAFLPDTVLTPPGAPRIVHLPAPGASLIALRLSVPLRERSGEAGVGRILQSLGVERARALAGPVGAHIEGSRTPWSVTYTVVGAPADFDYLAYLLREAVAEPRRDRVAFRRIRSDLRAEVQRHAETARGRVRGLLRDRASPISPPLDGTTTSLDRLTLPGLREVWARSHHASGMTLLIAGDIPYELILASFQNIGAPEDAGGAPPSLPPAEADRPRAQVLRHWYGEARVVTDARDPHAAVAALLAARELRRNTDDFEAELLLWETAESKVLAVIGAAYRRRFPIMRDRVRGILGTTQAALTPARVDRAVATLRREHLMGARTPAGRTTFVGRHMDATGDPGAARSYLERLRTVTLESAAAFLEKLAAESPVRAELRP